MKRGRGIRRRIRLRTSPVIACALLTSVAPPALAAPGKPAVDAFSKDTVGATTITLRAELNPDSYDTSYYFEYGRTSSYGAAMPAGGGGIGAGVNDVGVESVLSELAPDTTYHYRVVATNSQGTIWSEDRTFRTFGIEALEGSATNSDGSLDSQAGSHPYEVTTTITFAQDESGGKPAPAGAVKDVNVQLPPGLVGNGRAVPQCPDSMLVAEGGGSMCPPDTQIGLVKLEGSSGEEKLLPLFDLVPAGGTPARFGAVVLVFPVTMSATVSPNNGYALTVDLKNIAQIFPFRRIALTLWGIPADPGHDQYRGKCLSVEGPSSGSCPSGAPPTPLLTLPTACSGPLAFTLRTDS
jgi:hypothetical protein